MRKYSFVGQIDANPQNRIIRIFKNKQPYLIAIHRYRTCMISINERGAIKL
jgi:hypothetical protein